MEKTVATALFLIATVIAAVAVMNTVMPAVGRGTSALVGASNAAASQLKTDVKIVFATGDSSTNQITFWVKNVGAEKVRAIDKSDLFLTTPTTVSRIPYGDGTEFWTYSMENGTDWVQGVSVKVTIHLTSVTAGLYAINFIVPNGSSATREFSV